ncbi:uncharacterized protein LOC129917826 [Episyrphus balteatus]|uniref:uncharacterized protein LOC129917826 n=1 Tax=Episyrphus balteatus TaxID=286459 RepID=UPI00248659AE|nr:uncharacterized protein LOC129917826 [Episyrphus balteatus]XP_055853979.1 uncharacterized protein LOC129917826 [Episyrphus balteatus]
MLKWAVNGPYSKQTYLPTVAENTTTTTTTNTNHHHHDQDYTIRRRSITTTTNTKITAGADVASSSSSSTSSSRRRCSLPANSSTAVRKVCRKLSDNSSLRRKLLLVGQDNKENHLTSTPLPLSMRNASPLRKLGSLKDLSNITPDKFVASPISQTPKRIETPPKPQYASTLPTFGVEYSPCELVPGPILALRGIGIADNYFEKPRYLTHEFKDLNNQRGEKRQKMSSSAPPAADEESSLSSSKMGDLTLEKMIDAILESARKERKVPKAKQTAHHHVIMSPTYTPADDPASDLHEFWDPQNEKYQQEQDPPPRHPKVPFNEREVRTPETFDKHDPPLDFQDAVASCQLRRQRAVRRKRKLNELKSSVKNSAQKLLKRKSFGDRLDTPKKKGAMKALRNISPDSGRNSSSDLEDTLDGGNYTKRRLSFSPNDLNDN